MKISSVFTGALFAAFLFLVAGAPVSAGEKDEAVVRSPRLGRGFETNPVLFALYNVDTFKSYYDYYWEKNVKGGAYYYTLAYAHGGQWVREDYSTHSKAICRYITFADQMFRIKDGPVFIFNQKGAPSVSGYFTNNEPEGTWKFYDETGALAEVTHYLHGMPVGICYNYYPDSAIKSVDTFDESGTGSGTYTAYYEDGTPQQKGKYTSGALKDGTWVYYYPDGRIFFIEVFDKGRKGPVSCFQPDGSPGDTCIVNRPPTFPGGEQKLARYLHRQLYFPSNRNFKYLYRARVVVSFWVDESGNISDIELVRKIERKFDDMVVKAIRKMPAWEPAIEYNKVLGMRVTLPVVFRDSD